jgi:hypothetical protein
MTYSIDQLIRLTPRSRRENAAAVHVIGAQRVRRRHGGIEIITMTVENGTRRHHQEIRVVNTQWTGLFMDPRNGGVIVTCDCADWMYMFEWVMAQHGAAEIKHGNGDPPHFKNPNMTPGICKHLFLSCGYIKTKYY